MHPIGIYSDFWKGIVINPKKKRSCDGCLRDWGESPQILFQVERPGIPGRIFFNMLIENFFVGPDCARKSQIAAPENETTIQLSIIFLKKNYYFLGPSSVFLTVAYCIGKSYRNSSKGYLLYIVYYLLFIIMYYLLLIILLFIY